MYNYWRSQLDGLARLEYNWNTYGADPPNRTAIDQAHAFLRLFEKVRLLPARVVASSESGVGIVFRTGSRYADVECLNDGYVLATAYVRHEEPEVWQSVEPEETVHRIVRHFCPDWKEGKDA